MAEQYTLMEDVYKKSLSERYADYDVYGSEREIHKVVIDGNVFSGYKTFTFIWEKSYTKEPERSSNGTIGNLNSYPTFITPHLKINFAMISIDDYRRFYRLMLQKNEFTVTCYDIVNDKRITKKMYFAPDQFPTLYTVARKLTSGEKFIELTGVKDYTVELIGTNNELDLVSVTYLPNYPEGQTPPSASEGENDVYIGAEVIIGKSSTYPKNPPIGYKFKNWVDSNGEIYTNGYAYTINEELVLYAEWEPVEQRTLLFNYGVSTPMIDTNTMSYKMSTSVVKGKSIGILPTFESNPSVKYNDVLYEGNNSPYYNGQWWKTTQKVEEGDIDETGLIVNDNDVYWSDYDTTIYLLYDIKEYSVEYYIDGVLNTTLKVKYGDKIFLPNYAKAGYTFNGWYVDAEYKTKAPATMPPYPITLYAKWE